MAQLKGLKLQHHHHTARDAINCKARAALEPGEEAEAGMFPRKLSEASLKLDKVYLLKPDFMLRLTGVQNSRLQGKGSDWLWIIFLAIQQGKSSSRARVSLSRTDLQQ